MKKKVLGIVLARKGSKGFRNKNIAKLNGITLLELAVKVGVDCKEINDVYISTDSTKYEKIAINAGAKSLGLRPKILGADNTKSIDVIIDLIKKIKDKYEYTVLLQPTSPVREKKDIRNCINILKKNNISSCVSVSQLEEPHPHKLKKINSKGFIEPFISATNSELPRQSLPKLYVLNGAIYATKVDVIINKKTFFPKETAAYIMKTNINIDKEEDFILLESLINKGKLKIHNF